MSLFRQHEGLSTNMIQHKEGKKEDQKSQQALQNIWEQPVLNCLGMKV